MNFSIPIKIVVSCILVVVGLPMLQAETKQPNIIIFLVDDMGLMDTSVPMLVDAEGNPEKHPLNDLYQTPSMEVLAARGIRFSRFYAHSVCSPSRVSLLTGQNSARHRTTQWISPNKRNKGAFDPPEWNWPGLNESSVTLPRLLQSSGYKTIHVGKAHLGPHEHTGSDPLVAGFDINIAGSAIGSPGSYSAGNNYTGKNGKHPVPHLQKYHGSDTHLSDALTLEAIEQIKAAHEAQQPFFLHLSHYAAHGPFERDPRFEANYTESISNTKAQNFATLIEGMDKSLGDLLKALEKIGIEEETLLFFLGDNGSASPIGKNHAVGNSAPLRGRKSNHYEGGMRVPFIAAWAKPAQGKAMQELQQKLPIASGATQSQMGTIMDLFPTILELVGIDKVDGHVIDGQSLNTLLTGAPDTSRQEAFLNHFPHAHQSAYFTSYCSGDWKVIYHYVNEKSSHGPYELFNLKSDRSESENLATSNPEKLKQMLQEMSQLLEQKKALFPVKEGATLAIQIP
ncbi:MAG: sulfatase [Verrucomicrobiota bacterium]